MKKDEITEIYLKGEDIKKIIEKIRYLSFSDLKKKDHYIISVIEKNTDEKLLETYFKKFDKIKKSFTKLLEQSIFGNYHENEFTYLLKENYNPTQAGCCPSQCFLEKYHYKNIPAIYLTIDTKILSEFRHIYYDPEGAFLEKEFKKTFLVRGGIPFQAIKEFKLNEAYFLK